MGKKKKKKKIGLLGFWRCVRLHGNAMRDFSFGWEIGLGFGSGDPNATTRRSHELAAAEVETTL